MEFNIIPKQLPYPRTPLGMIALFLFTYLIAFALFTRAVGDFSEPFVKVPLVIMFSTFPFVVVAVFIWFVKVVPLERAERMSAKNGNQRKTGND